MLKARLHARDPGRVLCGRPDCGTEHQPPALDLGAVDQETRALYVAASWRRPPVDGVYRLSPRDRYRARHGLDPGTPRRAAQGPDSSVEQAPWLAMSGRRYLEVRPWVEPIRVACPRCGKTNLLCLAELGARTD